MLEGIATGYEEALDFPLREGGPDVPWLLASVPRSGSTFLSHVLWATGCLGAPLEYLNFDPRGPYGFAHGSPARQTGIWRSATRHRTSPNGVFGLKAFPIQLETLHEQHPALLVEVMRTLFPSRDRARVVRLRRRDVTAHAISYARAILSGVWRKEQEAGDREEPAYSKLAVERAGTLIERQEAVWEAMCRDLSIEPLVLWYEEAVDDPKKTVAELAGYLGVAIDPAAAIAVPSIERQAQAAARAWAEKTRSYAQFSARLTRCQSASCSSRSSMAKFPPASPSMAR